MERNEFRLNTNKEEAAINAGNSKLQIFPVFLIANSVLATNHCFSCVCLCLFALYNVKIYGIP